MTNVVRSVLPTLVLMLGLIAPAEAVEVWLTRGDQASLLEHRSSISFAPGTGSHSTKIFLAPATTYQVMEGFGASMTDSSAWLIANELNTTQRETLMAELFDPSSGIGMSFLRLPMGASDFALSAYTYDDMPSGQTDPTLMHFSIAHDEAYIIPILQQAKTLNPDLGIMASPWSAPAWMKSSQSLYGGSLSSTNYAAYAQYFVKFIQAYEAASLPIHAISVQNEPLHDSTSLPSMGMTTYQQSTFIGDHLGPAMAAAGIDTKILAYDHNWDQWNYPVVVMNDPEAGLYTTGSAFHGYGGNVADQTRVHDFFPDKDIYFTEITGGEWSGSFADALVWGMKNIMIGSTRNWAKAAVYWNIALNQNNGPYLPGGCATCRGLVTINTSSGNVTREVEYYIVAHSSKFVLPGARRIGSDSIVDLIETVAYRNPDGSEVLIALNPTGSSQWFNVVRGDESLSYRLTSKSVVTFVWQAFTPADMNCDGVINGKDVQPFVDAMLDESLFETRYPNCDILSGDLTGDGQVTQQDISPFLEHLLGN